MAYCFDFLAHIAQTEKPESKPLALFSYPPQPVATLPETNGKEPFTFWNTLVESPSTPPP
jgi:hypothetical protein